MSRSLEKVVKKGTVSNKQAFPKRKTVSFESQWDGPYHLVQYARLAFVLTVKDLFLRCRRRMSASWRRDVTYGFTNRGQNFTSPVVWDLFMSLIVREILQLKAKTPSLCRLPVFVMSIAFSTSCWNNRSIFFRKKINILFFIFPLSRYLECISKLV